MKGTDSLSVLLWNSHNIPHAQLSTLYIFLVMYTRHAHRIFTVGMGLTVRPPPLSSHTHTHIHTYICMRVCVCVCREREREGVREVRRVNPIPPVKILYACLVYITRNMYKVLSCAWGILWLFQSRALNDSVSFIKSLAELAAPDLVRESGKFQRRPFRK